MSQGGAVPIMTYAGRPRPQIKGVQVFRPQVYEREGISLVELNERVEKSVILVSKKVQKG